jgi:hypothetical protein
VQGRDDGQKLLAYIKANEVNIRQLIKNLETEIDLGGPHKNPALEALYRLGWPLYLKYQRDNKRWRLITKALEA